MAFLVASLFILTSLQLQGSNHEAKVENRRTQSLLIANSMQESSDDLTLMVGVGPRTARALVDRGVTRFAHLAA